MGFRMPVSSAEILLQLGSTLNGLLKSIAVSRLKAVEDMQVQDAEQTALVRPALLAGAVKDSLLPCSLVGHRAPVGAGLRRVGLDGLRRELRPGGGGGGLDTSQRARVSN